MSLEEIAESLEHEPGHGEEQPAPGGASAARAARGAAPVSSSPTAAGARRVSLLAAGALDGAEREETARAHLDDVRALRAELAELRDAAGAARRDPVRTAEPPVPPGVPGDARPGAARGADASAAFRGPPAWPWRRWPRLAAAALSRRSRCFQRLVSRASAGAARPPTAVVVPPTPSPGWSGAWPASRRRAT